MSKRVFLQCSVVLAIAGFQCASAEPVPPLRLVSPAPLDNPVLQQVKGVLKTAMQRAGLDFTLTYNPPERALVGVQSGMFDGDIARGRQFGDLVPGLIRVEPALTYGEFLAISVNTKIHPQAWHDLKPWRIAYLRGAKAIEQNTAEVVSRQVVDSYDACIGLARLGRVDVCIGLASALQGSGVLKNDQGLNVVRFEREGSYLWLNAKFADEAGRLSKALQKMDSQGLLKAAGGGGR